MKNRATIHMGASTFTVDLNDGKDNAVRFDLYAMSKDERKNFTKQFVQAFRAS
jgi:hypothetical protein